MLKILLSSLVAFGEDSFGEEEVISLRNEIRALIVANEVGLNNDSPSTSDIECIYPCDLPIIASSVSKCNKNTS